MTRTILLSLSLAVAVPAAACACSQKNAAEPRAAPVQGKVEAPVELDAALRPESGTITVRFAAAATGVEVKVWGVDGLEVTSAAPAIAGASYAPGDTATVEVGFRPGAGRSFLAVSVSGTFAGAPRTKVASFAVGTPSAEQQKREGTAQPGDEGQGIKVMR